MYVCLWGYGFALAMNLPLQTRIAALQWSEHRQALALAFSAPQSDEFAQAVDWLRTDERLDRVAFLVHHGLAAGVADRLRRLDILFSIPTNGRETLTNELRNASVSYLTQSHSLAAIADALERADIAYVTLKGAAIRDDVYSVPSLRVAGDIDLLVHPGSRGAAADLLTRLGFSERLDERESAHERTFSRGRVDIDLHWDILRPGRSRRPIVDSLLSGRVRGVKTWRLSDADTVFLMLVHPAFAKYVCSPHMGLNRVLDFLFFTGSRAIDWSAVEARLDETGMKAAGWCTLRWFQHVSPSTLAVPVSVLDAISPGKLRRAYLDFWIRHDLPGRLLNRADWMIQGAFTLFLHDRASDAWKALAGRLTPAPPDHSQAARIV